MRRETKHRGGRTVVVITGFESSAALDEVAAPDILVVPGWSGSRQETVLRPGPVQDWLPKVSFQPK